MNSPQAIDGRRAAIAAAASFALTRRAPAGASARLAPAGRRASVLLLAAALAACGGGSSSDPTTVNGNIAVAYVKRANTVTLNPLSAGSFAPGGDLIIREASSASAPEHNITLAITQGLGDAADPEVSYDGKKIVFAMNCPASNTAMVNGVAACTGHWNIWEYDMSAGGISAGTLRRITDQSSCVIPSGCDDVEPVYLPAGGGFVFTSNRQAGAYGAKFGNVKPLGGTQGYQALDEYERQAVFNLHTMDNSGGSIAQISFNQSHDRNPVILSNGQVMFSRWEHVADRNRFTVFTVNPDGTQMFVRYGAHADGNSYLHPREMDVAGKYANFITSDLMPLDRTHAGGALMIIDAGNYSDQNTPANANVPVAGGQVQATAQQLNIGTGLSPFGRVTTPFPLWDGTNRILVSYTPCEVSNAGVVVSCATLSATELAALSDPNRLNSVKALDPVQDNVPPAYAVYMFDPATQVMSIVAAPPAGFIYTDPIPIQARTEPKVFAKAPPANATLAAAGYASLTVASVYDTDGLDRMGLSMLSKADLPAGCTTGIPQIPPPAGKADPRASVADIASIKDPANAAYNCSPVRFVRVVRAIAPDRNMVSGVRQAIGNTNFEQSEILGYAPVEPDGSFQINIPANTPIAISVLDAQGRAFQSHTNWIQATPGEVRSCDGCHSPRRGAALNSSPLVDTIPKAWAAPLAGAHVAGYTMAQTHANYWATTHGNDTNPLHNPVYTLSPNLSYTDVWADPTQGGIARGAIQIDYSGLTTAAPAVNPGTGALLVNYPDHIQPLWTAPRGIAGASTCTNCHNANDAMLNLGANLAGTGRLVSYESLTTGAPVLDAAGNPVIVVDNGQPLIQTGPALVATTASDSQVVGLARQSRLLEILTGHVIMSGSAAQSAYPMPALDHSHMLNASEFRLVTEWIDLGSKYYNDPYRGGSVVLAPIALSETVFKSSVYPILLSTCAANCHLAKGSASTLPPGTSFVDNKFVLTGDESGDFNNTLTMISNTCNASDPSNYLLSKPSTMPHPANAVGQTAPPLPAGSANYNVILNWIASGGC